MHSTHQCSSWLRNWWIKVYIIIGKLRILITINKLAHWLRSRYYCWRYVLNNFEWRTVKIKNGTKIKFRLTLINRNIINILRENSPKWFNLKYINLQKIFYSSFLRCHNNTHLLLYFLFYFKTVQSHKWTTQFKKIIIKPRKKFDASQNGQERV